MADPVIKIKRSAVPGKIPTVISLPTGEFAINTYDGKVYIQQDQGGVGVGSTVITINPWSVGVGSIAYNTYFTAGSVGIGTTLPRAALNVVGVVSATSFFGDGANITGISTLNIVNYGVGLGGGGGGESYWISNSAGIHTLSAVGVGTTNPNAAVTSANTTVLAAGIVTAYKFYGDGSNITGISAVARVSVQSAPPSSPTAGDLWYHTTLARLFVYFNDGTSSQWVDAAPFNLEGSGAATVSVGATAPTGPSDGDLWYNSNYGRLFVYYKDGDSDQWVDAAPFNYPTSDTPTKTENSFVATEGQTTFTVTYEVGYVEVYLNGIRLSSSEYTASSGTSIVLNEAAALGDVIDVIEIATGRGPTGPQGPAGSAVRNVYSYTATASQTTFSATYSVGFVDVFLNGIKLTESEYTATDGSTIVLNEGATVGDIVEIIGYENLTLADVTLVSDTNPKLGADLDLNNRNITGIGSISITGTVTAISFSGAVSYATTAGIATYATTAGVSTYSTTAGIATYATTAGIATYSTTAGIATYASTAGIATYATTAGVSTTATTAGYASTAGIATVAQGLTGTPNITVGIITATNVTIGTATTALIVTGNARISGATTITGNLNAPGNYYVKLARLTNQTALNGADTLIGFTATSDTNGWYSGITTRTTPTVSGTYHVDVMINWQAGSVTNNQTNIQLRKNGNTFAISQVGIQTFAYTMNACGIVTMNGTTDYIDFTVYTGNPTSQVVTGTADGAWTKMEIFKIN